MCEWNKVLFKPPLVDLMPAVMHIGQGGGLDKIKMHKKDKFH